jgi:hypothetical protein
MPVQGIASREAILADMAAMATPKPMAASFLPAPRHFVHAAPVRRKNSEEKPERADPSAKAMMPEPSLAVPPENRSARPKGMTGR